MKIKKSKILVVEDEILIAKDIAEILNEEGYEVVDYVLSGEEAITRCDELKPDLVLMDIKLQGEIGGIDAAEKYVLAVRSASWFSTSLRASRRR